MIPSIVPYSDSDEEHGISKELETDKQLQFEPCPPVPNQIKKPLFYPSQTTKEISFNVPIQDLLKPVQGPMNPFINTKTNKTIMSGFMEQVVMDDDVFNKLHHRYNKDGISLDPDATNDSQFVGLNHVSGSIDTTKKNVHDSSLIDPISGERIKKQKLEREKGEQGEYVGPWASFTKDKIKELELEPEQVHYQPEKVFDSTILEQQKPMKESSVFHGQEVLDYLGRSYLHVPLDVGVDLHAPPGQIENFIPKQLIHTWTGHTKVVSQIKYFPKSAHLLLSCSMDQKVKLWDVYNDRACKRTFMGHSKGVKDVDFNYDGTQFISCGYDKFIKCWDTETGQVIHRFQTKHIPYCSTFNPTERKGHSFLVGCQDKKIYQFDTRTGEFVQEYAQHSGPINSITFIQDNTR
jgi:pre-mRNA-processing factor 17